MDGPGFCYLPIALEVRKNLIHVCDHGDLVTKEQLRVRELLQLKKDFPSAAPRVTGAEALNCFDEAKASVSLRNFVLRGGFADIQRALNALCGVNSYGNTGMMTCINLL